MSTLPYEHLWGTWPRLSETLKHPRALDTCQSCGQIAEFGGELDRWQEHDDSDLPSPTVLILCRPCSDHIVSRHKRLYSCTETNAPFPGSMPVCEGCPFNDALRCAHPKLKANGGEGLPLSFPKPSAGFVDGRTPGGKRFGYQTTFYYGLVTCLERPVEAAR